MAGKVTAWEHGTDTALTPRRGQARLVLQTIVRGEGRARGDTGQRPGWLAAGRMGAALVRRLLAAGCDVAVYNRTRSKAEPFAALGATVVDSAAELAGRDIVFATVGTPQDLLDAVLG